MSLRRFAPAVVVLLLALAGCAPGAIEPTGQPLDPTPTPMPTPTYQQPASPVSRLGIECGDLTRMPELSALVGGQPSPRSPLYVRGVAGGVVESISTLQRLPILQAGGLDCGWVTAESETVLTSVVMLPGIAASDWADVGPNPIQASVPGWGDAAYVGCASVEGYRCSYRVLSGSTWIEITSSTVTGTVGALTTVSEAFARAVVRLVAAAGQPLPLWVPADPGPAPDCGTLVADGTTITSVGVVAFDPDLGGYGDPIADAALRQTGGAECAYMTATKTGYVTVTVMTGAAWAWDSHAPVSNGSLSFAPVDGAGVDAVSACSQFIDDCVLHAITDDGSWLAVQVARPEGQPKPDMVAIANQLLPEL